MKYVVKCGFCDSTNLKITEYIQGEGEGFKCLDCNNEMSLREIGFKDIKSNPKKRKCPACGGNGHYDTKNSPKCSSCNGTGYEID